MKLMNKIKSSRGETLTETLTALLIIALAMAMLAGSIVSASKVNSRIKDYDTSFTTDSVSRTSGTVTLSYKDGSTDRVSVTVSKTNQASSAAADEGNAAVHYIYYEYGAD